MFLSWKVIKIRQLNDLKFSQIVGQTVTMTHNVGNVISDCLRPL